MLHDARKAKQTELPVGEGERLYVPGRLRSAGEVEILGRPFVARDIVAATQTARARWPDCGVFPWARASDTLRAAALAFEVVSR